MKMKKFRAFIRENIVRALTIDAEDKGQAEAKAKELLKSYGSGLWDYQQTIDNELTIVELQGAEIIRLRTKKRDNNE